jgi:predicted phage baseplate assembly protein
MPVANRPGLDALAYRVGTHSTFLETMKACLTDLHLEVPREEGSQETRTIYPLRNLTTRDADDPAIALLDGWATVADVLTFYQERIANEGYLRTATERLSILELARLVGYRLRPGVAASVYLAFTLEKDHRGEIPAGTRAQSLPGPGELPQSFETGEPLKARAEWNTISPRMNVPQRVDGETRVLYLEGTATNLKANDALLIIDSFGQRHFRRVSRVDADAEADRTKVALQGLPEVVLELADLRRLIRPGQVPEEEGPYSVVIGDRAAREIRQAVADLLALMEDEAQPPVALADAIRAQKPRLEQTLRIFQALNFDILAAWIDQVQAELADVLEQLTSQGVKSVGAGGPTVDPELAGRIKELLGAMPSSPRGRPFSREIGARELGNLAKSLDALIEWITSDRVSEGRKALAVWAQLLCVEQLEYVFRELGFSGTLGWLAQLQSALRGALGEIPTTGVGVTELIPASPLAPVLRSLRKLPSLPPANALRLKRTVARIFTRKADIGPQLLAAMQPALRMSLYRAWKNIAIARGPAQVYALRTKASLFGHNAPRYPKYQPLTIDGNTNPNAGDLLPWEDWDEWTADEQEDVIHLDNEYDEVQSGPESYVVVEKPNEAQPRIFGNLRVSAGSRAAYGMTSRATRIALSEGATWWDPELDDFDVVRNATVYAQSEQLELAQAPIKRDVRRDTIELDGLYDGLESGRWLIISGERTDVEDEAGNSIPGVQGTELVMLLRVEQDFREDLPGDTPHSTLVLSNALAYTYARESVTIYGNVVKATHGETREEVLGSGDGSQALQQFALRHAPLTHLAAPTAAGAESTLEVRVNDIRWHEADNLFVLEPKDRSYITRTDDDDETTVVFGDGEHGLRLPTGVENVKAVYRTGLGKPGNVDAEQIKLLATRPLGVKGVVNPLRASGGADRESRDQARHNAPLAVMALDRLVSVQDYADFARTFAGIGKTSARRLPGDRRRLVHLTIAGADDVPIDESSDLYRNLNLALRRQGDPYQPFQVDLRELMLLVISAKVRLHPDYLWEAVAPEIRAALLDAFSFERRELGQHVLLSEVISVMHRVPGVTYVDVDALGAVPEKVPDVGGQRRFLTPEEIVERVAQLVEASLERGRPQPRVRVRLADFAGGVITPAQLAYLTPTVSDALILTELT